jgi:hypothetical protein
MVRSLAFSILGSFVLSAAVLGQVNKVCEQPNSILIDKEKPSVYLEFEQFGKADDWKQSKLGEVSEKPKIEKGKDIWLRLHNNSCWELKIPTHSMYMSKVPDATDSSKSKIVFGRIADGNAANVFYNVEEQDRRGVPWGGHGFSESYLPSGFSLIFPVYREHLENDRSIYVNFNYGWETKRFSSNLAPLHRAFFWGYRLEEVKEK